MSQRLRERLSYYFERAGLPVRNRRLLFFETALEDPPEPVACSANVGLLTVEDLLRLEYCGGWIPREAAIEKLNAGSCFLAGAFADGRLLAYLWCEFETAHLDFFDLRMPLAEGTVYRAHSFVARDARNQGLFRALIALFIAEARRRGAKRVIACVAPNNARMLSLQSALGSRMYLTARYARIGPWRRYRIEAANGPARLITGDAQQAARALGRLGSFLCRPEE